jgi:hypothetical protein
LSSSRRWKTLLAGPTILLLLTGAFWWKLTLTGEWTFLESPDLAIQVRPWLDYQAREFHAGRFPLWDPYEWAGHTLIGQVQPGITNPLNWILFAMPLRDGHIPIPTLHWYWVLIHWLGAVFAYALCRDLGAGFLPAILGGSVFALTGFLGHTDWPQILMCCIWIPLILLFFLRVVRDHRPDASAALCGAAMGMAFLSGHHVVPTFTAILICALWLALVVRQPKRALHFGVFLLVTALIASAVVLPALEYSRQAIRWAGGPTPILPGDRVPLSVHQEYSLSVGDLAGLVLPRGALHANPYVGLTAFVLAAFALTRRVPAAKWLAAVAAGGILLSIAREFPLYPLLYRFVPMLEKAREPAFAIVLAQAGIAVLAALGLSRLRWWVAPFALALFFAEAVSHAPHLSRFDRPGSYLRLQQGQEDVIAFLKSQPGWFRVDFDDADVPYNAGDLYGIEQFGGAVSSMPVRTQRALGQSETPQRYGIRYHVGRTKSRPKQIEVFQSRSGLRVFQDPAIGEPLWGIHQPTCAGTDRFRLISRLPERTMIEAQLACPGLAAVGDAYYPGWRALVDGRGVPVQEVDGVRAVRVDAGRHIVEFRYHPGSVYRGFALSMLGVLLTGWLSVRGSRRAGAVRYTANKYSG